MNKLVYFLFFFCQFTIAQEQIVKSVLLDSVIIAGVKDGFDVDEFIHYVKTDTTFYMAFKHLRYYTHHYESELNIFNKKGKTIGTLNRWGTHFSDGKKAWVADDSINDEGKIFSLPTYNNTSSGGANVYVLPGTGELHRSTSSRQYKTNISDSAKGLTELLTLRPVDFNSLCTSDDPNKLRTGLIAEEVAEAGFEEYTVRDEENEVQSVEYGHMVALCVKGIQELSAKVTALENA